MEDCSDPGFPAMHAHVRARASFSGMGLPVEAQVAGAACVHFGPEWSCLRGSAKFPRPVKRECPRATCIATSPRWLAGAAAAQRAGWSSRQAAGVARTHGRVQPKGVPERAQELQRSSLPRTGKPPGGAGKDAHFTSSLLWFCSAALWEVAIAQRGQQRRGAEHNCGRTAHVVRTRE